MNQSSRRAVALLLFLAAPSLGAATRLSFEDLLANLKSPNAKTRQEAAEVLGKSRRREAVAHLAPLVHDPEVKVRLEVVKALRQLREPSAVPALVSSLRDGDPSIREEAIGTLVELYSDRERASAVSRFLDLFSDEFDRSSIAPYVVVDPAAIQGLAKALQDEDKDIREEAALALGILNGTAALRSLTAALQDPEPGVRGAAAAAIGKIGSVQDGRAIIPLLADTSSSVRHRALQAIGVLKVTEAGPALREMYEANRRKELGLKVLETLSRVGDPSLADLFQQLVQDADPTKRRLAVEGLGRISNAAQLAAFKKDYQREHNDEVKLAYSFALARMGDRAFLDSIVLSLPSRSQGARARAYLLEMGHGVVGELYPYLKDPDADVRAVLCEILGTIGDAGTIQHLTPLLSDPSSSVVDRATRAIERLRRATAAVMPAPTPA
jgi:HEAT repeat protein